VSQNIENKNLKCQIFVFAEMMNQIIPIIKVRDIKTNRIPARKCPIIIFVLDIGFESSKSRLPSFSIEGMNEETSTTNKVISINLGIPEIIASSKSSSASSNLPCPYIFSIVWTPSTDSRLMKYRIRKIINEKKIIIARIIFLASASLKIPQINAIRII
jgi:hypothetical protein